MSLLHPGGFRGRMGQFLGRVFGAGEIRHACTQGRKGRYWIGASHSFGSIAKGNRHGGPHEHNREVTRRLRQRAAREAKHATRAGTDTI